MDIMESELLGLIGSIMISMSLGTFVLVLAFAIIRFLEAISRERQTNTLCKQIAKNHIKLKNQIDNVNKSKRFHT